MLTGHRAARKMERVQSCAGSAVCVRNHQTLLQAWVFSDMNETEENPNAHLSFTLTNTNATELPT